MRAIAEIQIEPAGSKGSVREEVERACEILEAAGLKTERHDMSTDVEGELDEVFRAVKRIHQDLHNRGIMRLSTVIRLGTLKDKRVKLDQALSVTEHVHMLADHSETSFQSDDTTTSMGWDSTDDFVTVWQIAPTTPDQTVTR